MDLLKLVVCKWETEDYLLRAIPELTLEMHFFMNDINFRNPESYQGSQQPDPPGHTSPQREAR